MKFALLLLAAIAIAYAQDACDTFRTFELCFENRERCGFCGQASGGNTVAGSCMACGASAQCDGEWNSLCSCHETEEICIKNTVLTVPGTNPAVAKCAWCGGMCHNPEDNACCLKGRGDCTGDCFFCENTEKCIPKSHQANECPVIGDTPTKPKEDPCDAFCTTVSEPVCGTDGITYDNLCLLEKAKECIPKADLRKAYEGPCCRGMEEANCKEATGCNYCRGTCMREKCPALECVGKKMTDCTENAAAGCVWCQMGEYCYNPNDANSNVQTCEATVTCSNALDREQCKQFECSWCDAKDKCVERSNEVDAACMCSSLTQQGACRESTHCAWCPLKEKCYSESEFLQNRATCFDVTAPIEKCTDLNRDIFTTEDQIAAACNAMTATVEGKCEYCRREKVCLRADAPNRADLFCGCKTTDETICTAKHGCSWCKGECILESERTPDRCTDTPCFGRAVANCEGDCKWCDALGSCHAELLRPQYCSCSQITNADSCKRVGSADNRCLWCVDSNGDSGRCTDGRVCESGTTAECHRNLDKEQCAKCRDAANYIYCDGIGCIKGDTCDRPTTDPCLNINLTPILECVRKVEDHYVACLTVENAGTTRVDFPATSDRNTLTGIPDADVKDIVTSFEVGRQTAFPTCLRRVRFKPGSVGRRCICDRCVEFSADSPACPTPKWKIVIVVSFDGAELLARIRAWLTVTFPNLAKILDNIDIKIVKKTTKRQSDTYEVEVTVPDTVDDNEVRAVDDAVNDKDTLGQNLGGSVSSITNSGSPVAQQGSSTDTSGASSIAFGLVAALLLAMFFL